MATHCKNRFPCEVPCEKCKTKRFQRRCLLLKAIKGVIGVWSTCLLIQTYVTCVYFATWGKRRAQHACWEEELSWYNVFIPKTDMCPQVRPFLPNWIHISLSVYLSMCQTHWGNMEECNKLQTGQKTKRSLRILMHQISGLPVAFNSQTKTFDGAGGNVW